MAKKVENKMPKDGNPVPVAERKTTEQKFDESELKLSRILNSFVDGVYISSSDYKIEYMNSSMAKIVGEKAIGTDCYKSIYNLDKKCDWCVNKKLKQGESIDSEMKMPDLDMTYIVRSKSFNKGSVLHVFYDVTKIRESEKEIRKLSTAVEQSANLIVITDLEGNIEYTNPKFTKVTGYSAKEVIGLNPRILQAGFHSKEFYQDLWQTIKSGKIMAW